MNNVLNDYLNARNDRAAENVGANLKDYIVKSDRIDNKTLENYAFLLDEKFRQLVNAMHSNDEAKMKQFIAEYAGVEGDHGECLIQLEKIINPEEKAAAYNLTYSTILQVEQQTIENREGFLDYIDKRASLNRKNIENYVLDKTDKSSDAIKKDAYVRFADLYVRN